MKPIRLDVGDMGDNVTRLHEFLRKQGFHVSPEEEKRKFFGPSTREAVQKCQRKYGLPVTGCIDEQTITKFMAHGTIEPAGPETPAKKSKLPDSYTVPDTKATVTADADSDTPGGKARHRDLKKRALDTESKTTKDSEDADTVDEEEPAGEADTARSERRRPFRLSARDNKRLSSLTLGLSAHESKEKLKPLFEKAGGNFSRLKSMMEESNDFDDTTIRKLNFANELADLTGDDEALVGAFLTHHKSHSLRDIALNLSKGEVMEWFTRRQKKRRGRKKQASYRTGCFAWRLPQSSSAWSVIKK